MLIAVLFCFCARCGLACNVSYLQGGPSVVGGLSDFIIPNPVETPLISGTPLRGHVFDWTMANYIYTPAK